MLDLVAFAAESDEIVELIISAFADRDDVVTFYLFTTVTIPTRVSVSLETFMRYCLPEHSGPDP